MSRYSWCFEVVKLYISKNRKRWTWEEFAYKWAPVLHVLNGISSLRKNFSTRCLLVAFNSIPTGLLFSAQNSNSLPHLLGTTVCTGPRPKWIGVRPAGYRSQGGTPSELSSSWAVSWQIERSWRQWPMPVMIDSLLQARNSNLKVNCCQTLHTYSEHYFGFPISTSNA